MNIVLYCSVCGHALAVEKQGSNSVCEYAYIVPCEVCAAQPLLALDNASLSAPDDTTGAFDESIIGSLP